MAKLDIKVRKSRSQEDKQKALDTRKATQKRRASKTRKVFELKIDVSQTSKIKLKELDFLFI
jgi:hypothetical protein